MGKSKKKKAENKDDLALRTSSDPMIRQDAKKSIGQILDPFLPAVPSPIEKPSVDEDFHKLSTITRVTESLRYIFFLFEHAVSPKGGVRYWLKINLSLFLLLAIPIALLVPLLTYFMSGLSDISEIFSNITHFMFLSTYNILKVALTLLAITLVATLLVRFLFRIARKPARLFKRYFKGKRDEDVIDIEPGKRF